MGAVQRHGAADATLLDQRGVEPLAISDRAGIRMIMRQSWGPGDRYVSAAC